MNKYWLQIAKKNGIKYSTYKARIRRGKTPEEAATLPVVVASKVACEVRLDIGRKYLDGAAIDDLATEYGITRTSIYEYANRVRSMDDEKINHSNIQGWGWV